MKKVILLFVILCGVSYSIPRVKIVTEYITPNMLAASPNFTADSTSATGLRTVAKGTYVYLRAWNFGDTTSIQSSTWTMQQKPAGSGATLAGITGLPTWQKFKADLIGTYIIRVSVTTSSGSRDTTETVYASNYVGTGGFDNVPAAFPNCMGCHGTTPKFQDIFNRWKITKHATTFKTQITNGPPSYGIEQFRVHTLGYDHFIVADNSGFDDKARQLGWNWANYMPPKPSNWDSLKNRFPSLVAFSNAGCESCHGPGSEHVFGGGDTNKIMKSVDEGNCGKCHDSPNLGPEFRQWKNARHSRVIYSNSFAQSTATNDLSNCIRCHDGQGYVNFTKGIRTNTIGFTQGKHEMIACASCHDPHGSSNPYQLRGRPQGSDTLANGYHYTNVGNGIVCMDCHKSRRNTATYVLTRVTSATWGPHHNSQADLYLGQNLATFGGPPYRQTLHWQFLQNACVTCHMAPTDTSSANRDKVGGHALYLHNEETNYDHLKACQSCHPGKTRFDHFIADADYDGDNQIEPWRHEVAGSLTRLAIALPPVGIDSVAWQLIAADSNNVTLRKAYINYLSIRDGSEFGMHNAKYVIDALVASRLAIIGIIPVSNEIPIRFEISQNYPNPFNPATNINFSVAKASNVLIKIYDLLGREIKTLVNENMTPGKYKVDWQSESNDGKIVSSGIYFYRITAGDFVDTKKMILVR